MADFSGFLFGGRVRPAPGVAREVVAGTLASMRLANCGAVPVYLGGSSGLTSANGFPLRPGESFAMSVADFSSLFVVSDGVVGLVLPGDSGDYVHTPDSAAVSVTGDLDVRAHVALDDWTPAASGTLVAKRDGASDRSFWFYVTTLGKLGFAWSVDGSALIFTLSTTAVPDPGAGEALHLRATMDVSGYSLVFYTSTDGVSWSQLGAAVTGAATSFFDSTALLTVGALDNDGSGSRLAGTIFSAQVYDGIDGTLVADFDPSRDGGVSPVTSSTSGEVWTVAGNADLVVPGALDLPGASGDYAHSPDSAAVSVTGDLDLRCHAALDDWTPAAESTLVGKWEDVGPARSYLLRVKGDGVLELYVSTGTDYLVSVSSVAVPFADGEAGHVRVTLDVDDGASQRVSTFYTSTDGISWSQLGVPDTRSGAISIVDRTSLLTIGAMQDAGDESRTTGTIYSAQVFDGIDGTLVAEFDPLRDAEAGDATFTSASTGEVWTVAGNASVPSGLPAAVARVLW